jgi:hypothetical protein
MVTSQYGDVFKYNLEITLNDTKNNEKIVSELQNYKEIKEIARVQKEAVDILNHETKQQIQLIIGIDSLDKFINCKLSDEYILLSVQLSDNNRISTVFIFLLLCLL